METQGFFTDPKFFEAFRNGLIKSGIQVQREQAKEKQPKPKAHFAYEQRVLGRGTTEAQAVKDCLASRDKIYRMLLRRRELGVFQSPVKVTKEGDSYTAISEIRAVNDYNSLSICLEEKGISTLSQFC